MSQLGVASRRRQAEVKRTAGAGQDRVLMVHPSRDFWTLLLLT